MNDITLSIKLSKKLKQMGYPQSNTYLKWIRVEEDADKNETDFWELGFADINEEGVMSAPTVSELIENMPDCILENDNIYDLTIIKVNENYWVAYNKGALSALISFDGSSLMECLGHLWVWCKENGYKKGDINEK
jgi:hypothetical protein